MSTRLFFADGCPFAQRARALMTLRQMPFTPVVVDLEKRPDELLTLSPTGAVPLLEEDGFVLYESSIITEYLAEKSNWAQGFSSDLQWRARQRLAMKQFDGVLIPTAFAAFKESATLDAKPQWRKELEQLALTAEQTPVESMLGIHLATHWVRWSWAFADNPFVTALEGRMGPFLDDAAALPCVVRTNPERESTTAMMRKRFGPPSHRA